MSLLNAQLEFAEVLFADDLASDALQPVTNMLVYRNNMTLTLVNALQATYPITLQLLGSGFFGETAKEYIHRYPSHSANLQDYGQYFSDFLADYAAAKNLIYLAEIAKYEWLYHTLQFAAEHAPLDSQRLTTLAKKNYAQVNFTLHPASQLVHFHFPILLIIELCKLGQKDKIDINAGGVYLFMMRRDDNITLEIISEAEFVFLTLLLNNETVANALDAALRVDAEFHVEDKLSQWITNKTLVDFYVSNN